MPNSKTSIKNNLNEPQSEQILEFLTDSRLFNPLPKTLLKQIASVSRLEKYAPKEVILKENEATDRIFFLSKGNVGVYLKNELIVKLYRKGDLFGEMGLIKSKANPVSICAETEVELFSIGTQHLIQQTELENPDIHQIIHQIFALSLTEKLELTTNKAFQEMAERIHESDLFKKNQEVLNQAQSTLETQSLELAEAHNKLVKTNKFVTIGELMSGIAHDLTQPLLYIRAHAQMELNNLNGLDQKKSAELLSIIEKGTDRMVELIEHLKNFSNLSNSEFVEVDLKKVLSDAMLLCREQMIIGNIEVLTENTPQELSVLGNPLQLEQVFINIINNAKDALKGKESRILKITTQCKHIDQKPIAVVAFQDNGIGMDEATKEKIFAPFFTTKDTVHNLGMGLSICYALVRSHHGSIDVTSKKDSSGTTIEVNLPILKQ
ncbi:MAG: cyclic nucleotide-binding domain-containing protein [SAR324 cluster bacterium]|nr:cyclic nucleotide-binding domain-containing protein [SAR324 cluster bacterium]